MTVYKDEIEYYRGDFYPKAVTLYDSITKDPIDLTGAVLTMTVNKDKDPVDTTNQLFQIEGVLDADPTTGIVYFTPTAENTDQPKGIYWYDISMTIGSISKRTVKKDKFIILMDIGKD